MSKAFTRETDADDDEDPGMPRLPAGGKNYITRAGHDRLRAELLNLLDVERPRMVEIVHWAASNGDRSENGDYLYGKKRLREIDRRVRHLRKRLELLTVVDKPPSDPSRIYFGAWVTLEDEEGAEHEFRLVGQDEIAEKPGYISVDAPLGRALLGKAQDSEVSIETPGGRREWYVLRVSYQGER